MNCELPFLCAIGAVLATVIVAASFKALAKLSSKVGTLWIAGSLVAVVMLGAGIWYGAHLKFEPTKAASTGPLTSGP